VVLFGLGDAVGHGLQASTMMARLRNAARGLAVADPNPGAVLSGLSTLADADDAIATALYGLVDPSSGAVRWSSAGHPPPFALTGDGSVEALDHVPAAPALGAAPARRYEEHALSLGVGDGLVLTSDGVIERRDQDLTTGLARLHATLLDVGVEPAAVVADRIASEHCAQPEDDCCILVVKRTG